jgi:hypothetical protein
MDFYSLWFPSQNCFPKFIAICETYSWSVISASINTWLIMISICTCERLQNFSDKRFSPKISAYFQSQSTYILRVPQCQSPRLNRVPPPHPISPYRVCPPWNQRGGGHTRLRVREWGGGPNSENWRKAYSLCLLYDVSYFSTTWVKNDVNRSH